MISAIPCRHEGWRGRQSSSRFALAFDPARDSAIITTRCSPTRNRATQAGTWSGGLVPSMAAIAGSHSGGAFFVEGRSILVSHFAGKLLRFHCDELRCFPKLRPEGSLSVFAPCKATFSRLCRGIRYQRDQHPPSDPKQLRPELFDQINDDSNPSHAQQTTHDAEHDME